MKINVTGNDKISKYELPIDISGSFLFSFIPESTNIEISFNIFAENNNWYFINDDSIFISDNINGNVLLESNKKYKLSIKGSSSEYSMYTYEPKECKSEIVSLENMQLITIGSSTNSNISCSIPEMPINAATLTCNEGIWSISNISKSKLYVNNGLVKESKNLNGGDTIFIAGLRIIWMRTFIKIISSIVQAKYFNLKAISELPKNDNIKYISNDIENDVSLYSENDFFFRKPRFQFTNDEEEIKIDLPPSPFIKEKASFWVKMGSSASMLCISAVSALNILSNTSGNTSNIRKVAQIVTFISTLLGSFLLPKIISIVESKKAKKDEIEREQKYSIYLEKKLSEINSSIKKELTNLLDLNPSTKQCTEIINGNRSKLWERNIDDTDFLTFRVGIGNIDSSVKVSGPSDEFRMTKDVLLEKAIALSKSSQTIKNVPITYSLSKNFLSAIVCNANFSIDYVNGIILQLMTLHSPKELKIVLLTTEENEERWSFMKLMPACINDDEFGRFFATTEDEAKEVFQGLEKIYEERKDVLKSATDDINATVDKTVFYNNFDTYYLIITDNYRKYKNIKFIDDLLKFESNLGFSVMLVENNMRNIPSDCEKFVYVTEKDGCVFDKNFSKDEQHNFVVEYEKNLDMFSAARIFGNIPIQSSKELFALPQNLSFLEMYNVGKIEQLNIINKWKTSNPIISLQTPIGIHENGELFKLDLHEKAHGPHGLIAGSTGSGKSEFIITYILSMAINYSPKEVQFVLIDYKGGGLAGAFENREKGIAIPHLAGTITNLDTAEMNRSLVSIQSELKRRQRKFNELRDKLGESTIDIYKYQKFYREGLSDDTIAHLFIISDEFAELKSQQPDFMSELISISRIGRSLGVHLILATQKPSGVVNDQIWSNSRFKICLKVQTKSDSTEMLKRPEAASIKEVGRFYLQVGYDELFELGQSGWAGAKYVPTDKVVKKVDDSLVFIDNIGNTIKSINNVGVKSTNADIGDQLTNIVKYINNISKENNIISNKLWLDSIPGEIFITNLQSKYNYKPQAYLINPVIGEYDDPSNQRQDLLTLDITNNGNTLVYGMQGSGKENLISTIVTSICLHHSPSEINFYILDFGSETLKMFNKFPQVGDVILADENEKIINLLNYLVKEVERRKDLFSNYLGSYQTYIKESGEKCPLIICILNQFDNLTEQMPNISDRFALLFKDASKYGISFIITTTNSGVIRSRIAQCFNNKITLQLNDATEYRFLLDAPKGLLPSKLFGRGIVLLNNAYEFQTALISKRETITSTLKELASKLNNIYKEKAPEIVVMPKHLLSSSLLNEQITLKDVPVGISVGKLKIVNYNFEKSVFTPIICSNIEENVGFIRGLVEMLKTDSTIKIRIIDVHKLIKEPLSVDIFNEDYNLLIKQIKIEENREKEKKLKKTSVFIIIGLGELKSKIEEENISIYNSVFEEAVKYKQIKFIIFDNYTSFKFLESEKWFEKGIDQNNGIWLGDNASTQMSIRMPNLGINDRKVMFDEIGYVVKDSNHTIVRYVIDKGDQNEE